MKLDADTLIFGTIAVPNRPNKALPMYNAAFEALGVNALYVAFEPRDLAAAVAGLRALDIRGFSVSKPFKQEVIALLDQVDETAQTIGAVNTVLNDGGQLRGYNSDWIGALRALEEVAPVAGKRVVLIGAGGAARAIAYALKKQGASVSIYNRTVERGRKLAEALECLFGGSLNMLPSADDFDILINATSVGFFPDVNEMIVPANLLRPGRIVLDVVFNPLRTRLLAEAEAAGCRTVSGPRMLVHQAVFQIEVFTGKTAPVDAMELALEATFRE